MNDYQRAFNNLPFDPDHKEKTIRMLKDHARAKAEQPARPTWRRYTPVAVAACVAVILLGAGVLWLGRDTTPPPVAPDGGVTSVPTNTTTPTITEPTIPITRPTDNLEGVGGSSWKRVMWRTGRQVGPEFIADCLVQDELMSKEHYKEKWCSQFEFYTEMYPDPGLVNGTRTAAEYTLYHYVKEYDISREYVEKCVLDVYESSKEMFPDDPIIMYTTEEIDAIFAPTPTAYIRFFANPCTIAVEDVIYTPLWLEEHSIEEWEKAGITKEAVKEKLDVWEKYFGYPSEQDEVLKEKVDKFCG